MTEIRILRVPATCECTGNQRSTLYDKIKRGLFVPPVKIGARSSGFPQHEVNAINAARISGKSDDQIRKLVRELVEARKLTDARAGA
jgi:prophage regulatory protein